VLPNQKTCVNNFFQVFHCVHFETPAALTDCFGEGGHGDGDPVEEAEIEKLNKPSTSGNEACMQSSSTKLNKKGGKEKKRGKSAFSSQIGSPKKEEQGGSLAELVGLFQVEQQILDRIVDRVSSPVSSSSSESNPSEMGEVPPPENGEGQDDEMVMGAAEEGQEDEQDRGEGQGYSIGRDRAENSLSFD
jgi:hypothetical protein